MLTTPTILKDSLFTKGATFTAPGSQVNIEELIHSTQGRSIEVEKWRALMVDNISIAGLFSVLDPVKVVDVINECKQQKDADFRSLAKKDLRWTFEKLLNSSNNTIRLKITGGMWTVLMAMVVTGVFYVPDTFPDTMIDAVMAARCTMSTKETNRIRNSVGYKQVQMYKESTKSGPDINPQIINNNSDNICNILKPLSKMKSDIETLKDCASNLPQTKPIYAQKRAEYAGLVTVPDSLDNMKKHHETICLNCQSEATAHIVSMVQKDLTLKANACAAEGKKLRIANNDRTLKDYLPF